MDDHMTGPYGAPGGAPTYVPYRIWRFDLIWGALTLLAVLAAVAALATAETSGGRLVGGLIFGTASMACVAGWVNLHRHPSWLEVSGQAITRGTLGRPTTTTLSRATGVDLAFVLVGTTRSASWSLAQAGTDARLDVQGFDRADVRAACELHGWRFLA